MASMNKESGVSDKVHEYEEFYDAPPAGALDKRMKFRIDCWILPTLSFLFVLSFLDK